MTNGNATDPLPRVASPAKKFPLPTHMNATQAAHTSDHRRIKFTDQGAGPSKPTKLAVKPPRLMWKGKPSISSAQLQRERDMMISKGKLARERMTTSSNANDLGNSNNS